MDDDKLLEEIGRLAREEDAEEIEELPPLGADFHDRMVREWQARTRPPAPVARLVREPRRRLGGRRWLAVAATLVLAAVGWTLWRGRGAAVALPEYVPELTGAVSELRSPGAAAPGEVPVFADGGPWRLVLRPREPVDRPVEWRYYLAGADGELRPWKVGYSVSPEGAVRIEGTIGGDLPVGPGDWTLVVVYGEPGRLPDAAELATADDGDGWRTVRVPFRVEPGPAAALRPGLEVEYAGCAQARAGPVCTPFDRLTLWVRGPPDARLELRVGERQVGDPGVAVDGGRRFRVAVAAADGEVEARAVGPETDERWLLPLASSGWPAWLDEAGRLAYGGRAADARRLIAEHLGDAAPAAAAFAEGLLARLGLPEEEAAEHLERAVAMHRESGQLLQLAKDTGMLLHLDVRNRRFARVRRRLEALAADLREPVPAEAAFFLDYYRGILERDLANFGAALGAFQSALARARRLAMTDLTVLAEEEMGLVLQSLGRTDEALGFFRRLRGKVRGPCARANVLNNHAWTLILASRPGGEDPVPLLAEALALAGEGGCPGKLKLDLLLNQALAEAEAGRAWESHRALARADDLDGEASALHRLWRKDVEGRLALLQGRPADALERYLGMERLAASAFSPEGRWQAKIGQGRAHEALGDAGAALAALAAAEALLDGQSLRVPLHGGREDFVAQREEGARFQLELLLRAGRDAEALAVARRSRARVLRGLRRGHRLAHLTSAEQATWDREIAGYLGLRAELEAAAVGDWRLSTDNLSQAQARRADLRARALAALDRAFRVFDRAGTDGDLPPLRRGEVTLAYHPLPEGWVGFAARPGRVESHRFGLPADVLSAPEELSRRLLEPFREAIAAAEKVRVLPYGELTGVDYHALPWEGDVLLAARPVVYGLDLGAAPRSAAPPRRALVIADPRGDLPAARHEAAAVEETLRRPPSPWDVRLLAGDAASASRVRGLARSGLALLHYAGHGVADGPGSALLVAGESRITLDDVLAFERAPARVVLSSCESARAGGGAPVASVGLAQAFLVAGSERVVAAARPVGDRATAELFRQLYDGWDAAPDLAVLLRRVQLAWRARDPGADWASFRVLEP